jgi:hypothetical protein
MTALAMLLTAGGCNLLAYGLSQAAAPFVPETEYPAEYAIKGRSLAILVDMPSPTLSSEYPQVRTSLADTIAKIFTARKACGPIVPSHVVEAARRDNPDFATWSVSRVGKHFNVDLVLHVEIVDFRVRAPRSTNVYHGYAVAKICLVSPEKDEQVWPPLAPPRPIEAESLPEAEVPAPTSQEAILVDGFAEKIARLFYSYKEGEEPIRPKVK